MSRSGRRSLPARSKQRREASAQIWEQTRTRGSTAHRALARAHGPTIDRKHEVLLTGLDKKHRASIVAAHSETVVRVQTLRKEQKRIIHPRTDHWINNWNLLLAVALSFTSLITPFEIAFLEVSLNVLFFINRIVDCVFIGDMALQFFINSN